nr:WAP four-disulfide core domain protein 2 [Loxodonta africana]
MPASRLGPLAAALLLGLLLLVLPPVRSDTGEWGGERPGAQRAEPGAQDRAGGGVTSPGLEKWESRGRKLPGALSWTLSRAPGTGPREPAGKLSGLRAGPGPGALIPRGVPEGKGLRRRAHLLASPLPTLFYSLFLSEKPGSCPQLSSGFLPLGFCHDLCQVDSQCPGQKKCCLNGCGNAYCATPHF